MSSAYRKLRPMLRLFVDGIVAGEKPTHAVRRLRPQLKRPDVLAAKWKARPEVRAAIAERHAHATGLEERITRLEKQIANCVCGCPMPSQPVTTEGLRRDFAAERHPTPPIHDQLSTLEQHDDDRHETE